jgi:hypothetical protein
MMFKFSAYQYREQQEMNINAYMLFQAHATENPRCWAATTTQQ